MLVSIQTARRPSLALAADASSYAAMMLYVKAGAVCLINPGTANVQEVVVISYNLHIHYGKAIVMAKAVH